MKETLFDSKDVSYALKASFVVAINWKISVYFSVVTLALDWYMLPGNSANPKDASQNFY